MELSLKRAIQGLKLGSADSKVGIVMSVSPLIISPEYDEKLRLGEGSLCIPEHLTNHNVRVNIPALGLEQADIKVYAALRKGERVFLVSVEDMQKYVVIGRVNNDCNKTDCSA